MKDIVKNALAHADCTIRDAIKKINDNGLQILIVVDDQNRLIGTVTDGDIRRSILKNISLDEFIGEIMNRSPRFVYKGEEEKAYELMLKYKIRVVPVLDSSNVVIDLIMIEELFGVKQYANKSNYVFIMAGGKGTRLDPFTKILPKPLIPIGEKPIIEVIMSNFKKYGFNNFIISLNYKAEMIKLYFSENPDRYNITYTNEKEFLGTAGALQLAKGMLKESFIVSNCDVIVEIDFDDLLKYHKNNRNQATIVGVIKNMQIPYGVLDAKDGILERITEKPEYYFVINSGIYVLEPEIIDLISEGQPINMPDLLLKAKECGFKVGVYPISSKWFDVGQWEEYKNTLEYFKKLYGDVNV